MVVVGVDGCRPGWIAVVLRGGDAACVFATSLHQLRDRIPDARAFAVDIPIGLPCGAARRCADDEARKLLGARRSSVFITPVREALDADTHAEASRRSIEQTGQGISQQAYALRHRIREAEAWCVEVDVPVWEVHPEVSFTLLLGHPARFPKKTWAGMQERREALEGAGIHLRHLGEDGRHAAVDDVLDAAAAAWTGRRLVRGEAVSLPARPEVDPETGRRVAIWA